MKVFGLIAKTHLNSVVRLITGLVILIIGIFLVVEQEFILVTIIYLVSVIMIFMGILFLVDWIIKVPRIEIKLLYSIITISLGVLMFCYVFVPSFVVTFLFGIYLMFCAFVEFIDSYISFKNKTHNSLKSLLIGIFYFIFSFLLTTMTYMYKYATFIIIGIYCILFGGTYVLDFLYSTFPKKTKSRISKRKKKIKRHFRITMPNFISAFIPNSMAKQFNDFLASDKNQKYTFVNNLNKNENEKADLKIYFHISERGFNAIGHCDIEFEGEIISYGNYDETNQNKLGMGPGVLLISNPEKYISFRLKFNKLTIFSFGLRLNEEQKQKVRERIKEIKAQTYFWDPPYLSSLKKNKKSKIKSFRDFSSLLYYATGANFYKFKQGEFKTYFVMTKNCVSLVESIVCKAGTDILSINDIISPGTFYDYLQTEYLRKDSIVISRNIYNFNANKKN